MTTSEEIMRNVLEMDESAKYVVAAIASAVLQVQMAGAANPTEEKSS